jgi:hypothetical protein
MNASRGQPASGILGLPAVPLAIPRVAAPRWLESGRQQTSIKLPLRACAIARVIRARSEKADPERDRPTMSLIAILSRNSCPTLAVYLELPPCHGFAWAGGVHASLNRQLGNAVAAWMPSWSSIDHARLRHSLSAVTKAMRLHPSFYRDWSIILMTLRSRTAIMLRMALKS